MQRVQRRGAHLIGLFVLSAGAGTIQAQHYPSRSVRIVVPFSAGGPTDILARLLAQRLPESMGQQFIIDNRAGGGGTIATDSPSVPEPATVLSAGLGLSLLLCGLRRRG